MTDRSKKTLLKILELKMPHPSSYFVLIQHMMIESNQTNGSNAGRIMKKENFNLLIGKTSKRSEIQEIPLQINYIIIKHQEERDNRIIK
jgi:hypothetical protein